VPTGFVIHLGAGKKLTEINQQVASCEATYGPLSEIGNDGATTTLKFLASMPPTKNAVLAAQNKGVPDIPAGNSLVCKGTIFIEGALVLSAATRPQ
jgi:hypothetical protein